MKKYYFFSLLFALLAGTANSLADTYKVDFETAAETSEHNFRVATGWSHVVDGYEHPFASWLSTYVEYSYIDGQGVDNSKALKIGSQYLLGVDRNDLLVTPKIKGAMSIMVKSAATDEDETASIRFYNVAGDAMGDEITPAEAPALTTDGFVKYVLPEQDGATIGIRGEYVYIDNFEAPEVEIEMVRSMAVVDADLADDNDTWEDNSGFWPKTYVNCDEDGNFTLSYNVELKNTGDVTLNPGDEGFTLTFLNQEKGEVIADQLPVNVSIEPGETKTANFKMQLNSNETGEEFYLVIRENLNNVEKGYYDYTVRAKRNTTQEAETSKLQITAAICKTATTTNEEGLKVVKANADGNFTLTYDVTIKNTGDKALTPGTDGYTLQLVDAEAWSGGEIGEAVPVSVALEPGEEATVTITATDKAELHPDAMLITVSEGISNTSFYTEEYIHIEASATEIVSLDINEVNVTSETHLEGFDYLTYADADGNFTVEAEVELENTGNVTLKADDENMTLTLFDYYDETEYATANIGRDIEPGETVKVTVKAEMNIEEHDEEIYYYVRENVSNNEEYVIALRATIDPSTGIITLKAEKLGARTFNLGGQQGARKGIVIKNGKKYHKK